MPPVLNASCLNSGLSCEAKNLLKSLKKFVYNILANLNESGFSDWWPFPPLPRISQSLSLFVVKVFPFKLFAFHAFQLLQILLISSVVKKAGFLVTTVMFSKENYFDPTVVHT